MANQILAGAVVQAGMVIAGVDADNPPVTSSGSSTALTPYEGPGPVNITGDFGIEPNTAFTFEIQFTAPIDNVYRNIFTLGGSPDKKYGAFSLYSNNSTAGRISGGSSVSGTTTDGEYGFFAFGRSAGWIDTEGAQPRLTLIRNANNVTHLFRDGVSIYSSSVSEWPTSAFDNADLTLFAYADGSYIMNDGTGVTIHGWRFEKSNSYSDQVGDSVIGQGVEIDLLPLDNTAPEAPPAPPAPAFPHAGNFVDNFGGLQKNTSSLAHANGYNWASVHEWVNYGEPHPSTNTDPRISYIRQDNDGYVYALFTINNGQPLPGANGSYTGIHSYYGFGVWNASNAVFNLYSARSITEVDPVGNHFQVLAKTKVPYTLGLENFPAVWNEDVQGWVHTDWSA